MKRLKTNCRLVVLAIAVAGLLIACQTAVDPAIEASNQQINVFGLTLQATKSSTMQLFDSPPEQTMCILGEAFEVTDKHISFIIDASTARVISITTKNQATSIYGIAPQMSFDEARAAILGQGFQALSNSKFQHQSIQVELSSKHGNIVQAVTIRLLVND